MAGSSPHRSVRARRGAAAVLAPALLSLAAWVAWGQATPGPTVSPAQFERGLEVYLASYCGVCHQLALAGSGGPFGPPHDAMGVVAAARVADPNYRGAAGDAAGYIRESIVAPDAYLVPGYGAGRHRMPSYAGLDEADLDALVAMLLTLPRGP